MRLGKKEKGSQRQTNTKIEGGFWRIHRTGMYWGEALKIAKKANEMILTFSTLAQVGRRLTDFMYVYVIESRSNGNISKGFLNIKTIFRKD